MGMIDMAKVMTWLEICGKNRDCSGNCPYGDGSGEYEDRLCREDLMADALALLKEQDAVEPITEYKADKRGQWIPIKSPTGVEAFGVKEMTVMNVRCSVCGSEEDVSFTGYKYCPRCGAKMEGW